MVYNKIELYRERVFDDLLEPETRLMLEAELKSNMLHQFGENIFISALTKEGMDDLRERMMRLIKELYVIRYPHQVRSWG